MAALKALIAELLKIRNEGPPDVEWILCIPDIAHLTGCQADTYRQYFTTLVHAPAHVIAVRKSHWQIAERGVKVPMASLFP